MLKIVKTAEWDYLKKKKIWQVYKVPIKIL